MPSQQSHSAPGTARASLRREQGRAGVLHYARGGGAVRVGKWALLVRLVLLHLFFC